MITMTPTCGRQVAKKSGGGAVRACGSANISLTSPLRHDHLIGRTEEEGGGMCAFRGAGPENPVSLVVPWCLKWVMRWKYSSKF